MTEKQMIRAMKKHGISVVYDGEENRWYAGVFVGRGVVRLEVDARNHPVNTGLLHTGSLPEIAVEDYCNARNLEWDR